MSRPGAAAAALAALVLGGCGYGEGSFADYPGFAAYYAANPPTASAPDAEERALLARHRPRIFLPEGNEGPIDFYRDYVAHGTLVDENGGTLSERVTPELLNAVRGTLAVFTHEPPGTPPRPVVYGRVDRERFELGGRTRDFTFLTYTLVFRHSGIAAGVTGLPAFALELVGDLDDWHQLDHYVSLVLALDEELRPRVATFQHHNYMRSHVLGEADGPGRLRLPPDGRLAVDVAVRSNELYPHRPGRTERRAAPFLSPRFVRYLVDGGRRPLMAAPDVTDPEREIDPPLAFLPPADAFYTFRGWLGERRLLPGRDGPPGADFRTLPALMPRGVQIAAFHWWEGDRDYAAWVGERGRELWREGSLAGIGPFRDRLAAMLDAP